jgi:DNA polymerase I-like protein with 3'-5' exonuclease and polymerase domains
MNIIIFKLNFLGVWMSVHEAHIDKTTYWLQIHDELVLEVDKQVSKEITNMSHYYMEGISTLKIINNQFHRS